MVRGLEIAKGDADLVGDASYTDLLSAIRKELQESRVNAARAVNSELVALYWRIGTMILQRQEAEGWGAKVIDQLAADLKEEAPKGFSVRNLKYMRAFAQAWPESQFVQTLSAQITWSHHQALLDKLDSTDTRLWYAERAAAEGWSVRTLRHHIVTRLHERQGLGASNFPATLAPPDSDLAQELLTNPLDLSFVPGEAIKSERNVEHIGSPIGVATYKVDETELETELSPELKGQLPEPGQLQANLKRLVDERGEEIEAVVEGQAEDD